MYNKHKFNYFPQMQPKMRSASFNQARLFAKFPTKLDRFKTKFYFA
jgi:hypothetical protein